MFFQSIGRGEADVGDYSHGLVERGEVGVLESLLGCDSAGGIVDQHALNQVDRELISLHNVSKPLWLPHGEGLLEVGKGGHARPDLLVRRSKHAEDAEQLINLTISREERILRQHLGEDATQAPNVDRRGVVARAKQNLRRSVPQGDHLQDHQHGHVRHGHGDDANRDRIPSQEGARGRRKPKRGEQVRTSCV